MTLLILVAFLVSGVCGLVYEVVWSRMLGLVMGNTVYAVSTTLAAFMAGLALGSYVLGRRADRLTRPGRFYGLLEVAIGLYGALSPVLILGADPLYSLAYERLSFSLGAVMALRFALAALVVLVPAALMGATLPVLSAFYASSRQRLGWEIGRLYSINTWGAAAGALLAGFVLIPTLGVRASLVGTAAVNVALGLLVLTATRAESPRALEATQGVGESREEGENDGGGAFALVAIAFAASGFAALVYEVAWTRIISLLIGPSTYAFALMLGCFLVGLAGGSALAARFVDRAKAGAVGLMAVLLVGAAVSALALVPAAGHLVTLVRETTREHAGSFLALYASYFGIVAILLLLPATALGAVFPAAVRAAAPLLSRVARRTGQLYAANTVGAIVGSVAAGFVLIPAVGLSKAVAVGAAVQLVAAIGLSIRENRRGLALAAAGVLVFGLVLTKPLDPKALSSGPYKYLYGSKEAAAWEVHSRDLLYYKEGVTATVAVIRRGNELALAIDGKVDASLGADMDTQILLAHLPLLLAPSPRTALVVGLASGVTLGSATRYRELERIVCVETSPEVVEASSVFSSYNYDPLSDPRVELVIHDARNLLKLSDRTYDVIISEPSNPWMSGSSALFTREFFESCLARLKDNGIMCQWVQGYGIPLELLQTVIATFCDVFPHVSLWMPLKGDFILLGSASPIALDPEQVASRMSRLEVAEDLQRIRLRSWQELAGMNVAVAPELCRAASNAARETDDRPLLEFALPKTLHRRIELAAQNLAWLLGPLGSPASIVKGDGAVVSEAVASAASYKDYIRGQLMEWKGDADRSAEFYGKAIAGPAGRRKALEPLYLALCHKGLLAERAGRFAEAEDIYRNALALIPQRTEAHYMLGVRLAKSGRREEAVRELEAAAAGDSLRVEPLLVLADVLSELGEHARAEQTIQKAISLRAVDGRAWYGAARVYARAGRLVEAQRALEQAIRYAKPSFRQRVAVDTVLSRAGVVVPQVPPGR